MDKLGEILSSLTKTDTSNLGSFFGKLLNEVKLDGDSFGRKFNDAVEKIGKGQIDLKDVTAPLLEELQLDTSTKTHMDQFIKSIDDCVKNPTGKTETERIRDSRDSLRQSFAKNSESKEMISAFELWFSILLVRAEKIEVSDWSEDVSFDTMKTYFWNAVTSPVTATEEEFSTNAKLLSGKKDVGSDSLFQMLGMLKNIIPNKSLENADLVFNWLLQELKK